MTTPRAVPEAPVSQEIAGRIHEYLGERQDEMIAVLAELVRLESPSLDPTAQIPILTLLTRRLEQLGFDVRHIAGTHTGGHLFARPRNRVRGRQNQLLLGHSDTVWPRGTLNTMPVAVDGNRMRGPGIFDMKAGLVQMLYALQTIAALDLDLDVTPIVFINSDEEIGSPESARYIERLARRVSRVFVVEPSVGENGNLKTGRKGVGQFTITVEGKAAHAGLNPEGGKSAILEMSYVIQKLFALNDYESGVTVNVGEIEGGLRPNVVAPKSRAIVDVRVPTLDDAHRIEETIHALQPATPGVRLIIEGEINRPPMEHTPRNQQLWSLAQSAGSLLGLELHDKFVGGASDGNLTSRYAATLDGLGAVGDGAHAAHEFVYLDKLVERTALLAVLLIAPPLVQPP